MNSLDNIWRLYRLMGILKRDPNAILVREEEKEYSFHRRKISRKCAKDDLRKRNVKNLNN